MKISKADLKRNLARYGKRWGIVPMVSKWGEVLAAERVPVKIPLAGFSIVVHAICDITAVNRKFPFSSLLATRKTKTERSVARRVELATMARDLKRKSQLSAIKAEMRSERNKIIRGRQIFIPR